LLTFYLYKLENIEDWNILKHTTSQNQPKKTNHPKPAIIRHNQPKRHNQSQRSEKQAKPLTPSHKGTIRQN